MHQLGAGVVVNCCIFLISSSGCGWEDAGELVSVPDNGSRRLIEWSADLSPSPLVVAGESIWAATSLAASVGSGLRGGGVGGVGGGGGAAFDRLGSAALANDCMADAGVGAAGGGGIAVVGAGGAGGVAGA